MCFKSYPCYHVLILFSYELHSLYYFNVTVLFGVRRFFHLSSTFKFVFRVAFWPTTSVKDVKNKNGGFSPLGDLLLGYQSGLYPERFYPGGLSPRVVQEMLLNYLFFKLRPYMGIQAFPELNPSRKTEKVSDAEHYVKLAMLHKKYACLKKNI